MKKYALIKYVLGLSLIFSLFSCSEDNDSEFSAAVSPENLEWQANTNIVVTPVEGKAIFVIEKQVLGGETSWSNKTVELNMQLNSVINIENFESVDFYVTAEELNGYNYMAPFDTKGKLLSTVLAADISENGELNLAVNAEDAAALFQGEFTKSRPDIALLEGDLFEIHWVVNAKDGTSLDSRDYVDGNYRHSISVRYDNIAPLIWDGTFNFEYLVVGDGLPSSVGDTGQITIEATNPGEYDVPEKGLVFNLRYGKPGKLFYDYESGETYVEGSQDEEWTITYIDATTIEIAWTYKWSNYGEYGTVKLTRTDGIDWPSNIHSK